ncbi:MAG: hypothetical protein R3F60_06245 [bacterium]
MISPGGAILNPGGAIPADAVIGRDREIEEYWLVLRRQSIALLAPRRVGKTSICRRMLAYPPDSVTPIMRNLEGLQSASEFVARLADDVDHLVGRLTRVKSKVSELMARFGLGLDVQGVRVQLVPTQWKILLDELLHEVNEATPEDGQVVFFWDEFTLFFGDLARRGAAEEAMVLLDRLRAARQAFPRIRMVVTGSIGFEEVMEQLRQRGYANDPINDVDKQIVPLLDEVGAVKLAEALLSLLPGTPPPALAQFIAQRSEGHPLVIQHMADRLRRLGRLDKAEVEGALQQLIADDSDPLELSHYLERLATYLPAETLALTRTLLDTVALEPQGVALADLAARLGTNREQVLTAVGRLRKDQYFVREGTDHRWRFRLDVLRRWWMQERGL